MWCLLIVSVVNLQLPSENESTKIEVGEIPIDLLPKLEFTKPKYGTTK